jgi:integrase
MGHTLGAHPARAGYRGQGAARALVSFLNRPEVNAMLPTPDQHTRSGRRDHPLPLLAVQTGLRLSEPTGHGRTNLHIGTSADVREFGKLIGAFAQGRAR